MAGHDVRSSPRSKPPEKSGRRRTAGERENRAPVLLLTASECFIHKGLPSLFRSFSQAVHRPAFARAALFTNQIPAFEAAPSVYRQRLYEQAFAEATKDARKYVLLVTNTSDVIAFDLQDKIRADLLNLSVTNSP